MLNELFTSANGNVDIKAGDINGRGELVVSAGNNNQGIIGKTDIPTKIFPKGTITVDMFGGVYYRGYQYKLVTHGRVFSLDFKNKELTDEEGIYLSTQLFYLNQQYNYANMASWNKINHEKIKLPVYADGSIAFDYMRAYIKELESERIRELESYLMDTGLNDYTLSVDEEKAVADFKSNNMKWGEFEIGSLFRVQTSAKKFNANKVNIQDEGYPYVVRTSLNNGTRGRINENQKYLNKGNTISFGQDTATSFYQEEPYFTADKIKILVPKFKGFNKILAQFFTTSLSKSFSTFTWGSSSYNVKIINSQKIKLLVNKDDQPDYEGMEMLIRAFEKIVIKGVVDWKDKQIQVTKDIVE